MPAGVYAPPMISMLPRLGTLPGPGSRPLGRLDRSLIMGLPPFEGMAADELDTILDSARSLRVARNAMIFGQEEEAHSFFSLWTGG